MLGTERGINLRVQAYSCHPVWGGRGEGGWDTDLKAFSLNNGCPVFWEKARSSQFNPRRPFIFPVSHCSKLFSTFDSLPCLLFFLHSPVALHTASPQAHNLPLMLLLLIEGILLTGWVAVICLSGRRVVWRQWDKRCFHTCSFFCVCSSSFSALPFWHLRM